MNDIIGNVLTHESSMQASQHLTEPFLSNPFRLLRLTASANNEEINTRYREARIQAQLDPGNMQQGILDKLLQAQGELLDRRKRIPHEASWFYDPAQPLFDEIVPELDPVLEDYRSKALGSDRASTLAKHDYANWLLLHACHADDSETQKGLCLRALASWSELLTDTAYLEILSSSSVSGPISDSDIWQGVVFATLAEAGRRQTSKENWAGAIPYAEATQTFGADSEQILLVCKPALASLQDNGRGLLKQIQEERGKIPLTTEAAQEWAAKVETAFTPLQELAGFLDEDDCIESRAILDDAAELLRSVAIALNNEEKEYPEALGLLYMANDLAGSEDLKTKLEVDLRQVRENTFQWALARAVEFGEREMWIDATKSIDYAEGIADTDEERKAVSSLRTSLAHRKRRRYVVASILGAIIIIPTIAVVLSNTFSGSQESVQPPVIVPLGTPALMTPSQPPQATASAPRPTPSSDRSALLAQIRANEARLSTLESQVDSIEAELKGYKTQIEAIRTRYPSLRLPEPYYSQHNNLVRQYNSRLDSRDQLVAEYDSLVDSTNALVGRYNRNR